MAAPTHGRPPAAPLRARLCFGQATLQALNEAAQAYIEVMVEKGQSIPEGIEAADSPVVAVSV